MTDTRTWWTIGEMQYDATGHDGTVEHIKFSMMLDKPADAVAFVAQFPKSLRMKATELYGYRDGQNYSYGFVTCDARLVADGVNRGYNESGLKRIRGLFKALTQRGIAAKQVKRFANSMDLPDAANATALAAVDVPAPFKSPFKCPFCGETYEYGDPNHSHN